MEQELLWRVSEASDNASAEESYSLYDIWNGVKSLFTAEEAGIELQPISEPVSEMASQEPRLLSNEAFVSLEEELEEKEEFGVVGWDETPDVFEAPEFMSPEYVADLERRELQLSTEFGEAGQQALSEAEIMGIEMSELTGIVAEEAEIAGKVAQQVVGEERVNLSPTPGMGSEDFAYMLQTSYCE